MVRFFVMDSIAPTLAKSEDSSTKTISIMKRRSIKLRILNPDMIHLCGKKSCMAEVAGEFWAQYNKILVLSNVKITRREFCVRGVVFTCVPNFVSSKTRSKAVPFELSRKAHRRIRCRPIYSRKRVIGQQPSVTTIGYRCGACAREGVLETALVGPLMGPSGSRVVRSMREPR